MRVHHLNCATLCPPLGRFINGPGLPALGRGRLVCHCLLIETERDGLVLVDTGIGLDDCREPARMGRGFNAFCGPRFDPAETARRQIEAKGYSAADVRHVIVTHLDLDHAGGLPDFPHASVHVMAAEQRAASEPVTRAERERYRPAHFAHDPRWVLHEASGEPWRGFPCVRGLPGLPPEILLVPLVGHTRGHTAVAVETEAGWLVHAGDAYFHRSTPRPNEGPRPAGLILFERAVATEWAAVLENHRRLRELAAESGPELTLFCAHDPVEYERALAPAPATT
ncbi:MAG: MBL fold metallo-hydrolase [Polyangiaceae bacterium]|nr:MBL fold metallo-hydrolase [Polyangiaceae bacterium]